MDSTFLVVLAIVFLVALGIIVRSGINNNTKNEKEKQKKQSVKEKKVKGPSKNALKKEKRPNEIKEWSGVDTAAKDAQEMLEFLKGKDPIEIAKQHTNQPKQSNKKKGTKKVKDEVAFLSSEDSAGKSGSDEGFSVISTKKPKKPKDENQEQNQSKKPKDPNQEQKVSKKKPKVFFKDEKKGQGEKKGENKGQGENRPRRERKKSGEEFSSEEGEKKWRPQRNNNDNNEQRVQRENKEQKPRKQRKEKIEGEDNRKKEQKRVLPSKPPNVKYEEADINDILNSITQDYNKPKPQTHRIASIFSRIPRHIVTSILSKLEASDLLALSEVNNYFCALVRKDVLWRDLLLRDFGVRDINKYRNFRAAYKGEYKKNKQKKKKDNSLPPHDELKDTEKKRKERK